MHLIKIHIFAEVQITRRGLTSRGSLAITQLISLSESTIVSKLVGSSYKSNGSIFLPCQTVHRKVYTDLEQTYC